LLPAELDVFWDLVITRLAVSVAVAAGRAAEESGNAYHQASAAPAARALIRLLSAGTEAALRAARVTP